MRTRILLPALLAVAAGATGALLASPPAEALTAGEVVGTWKIHLVGDAWRAKDGATTSGRLRGDGVLVLRRSDVTVNDGKLDVEITLDARTEAGILGEATPAIAFKATAALSDDALSAIAVGQSGYVNALNLRFDDAKKLSGMWLAVFPAGTPESDATGYATGVGVKVTGKHVRARGPARGR